MLRRVNRNLCVLVLLTLLLVFGLWVMRTPAAAEEGELYIETPQDLISLAENVNQGNDYDGIHVVLSRDLDMDQINDFIPIGKWNSENYFRGIFDGDGHTIRNLRILPYDENGNIGLFGTLGGTVCNLVMENCYVCGAACGVICSISDEDTGSIYNCEVRDCTVDALYTDIIGGQYFGKIENCVIDGNGDAEELNKALWFLSEKTDDFPYNLWEEVDGKAVLSSEKANLITDMELRPKDGINIELRPFYREEDGVYWFVLPSGIPEKGMELIVTFLYGNTWNYILGAEEAKVCMEIDGYSRYFGIMAGGTLSSVHIETGREDALDYLGEDKSRFLSGNIQILDENGQTSYIGNLERVKGRGNNSFLEAKKGYSIKLNDPADLLGLGTEKDFLLIPGYRDASLITFRIIQDLSQDMGFDFALESQFVDLYVQGEYQGVYLFSEKVETGSNRIAIDKGTKPEERGYLFELNSRGTLDMQTVTTDRGNMYGLRSPEEITEEELDICELLWNDIEDALFDPDGYNGSGKYYTDYMDLESLSKQWLLFEACGEYSICSNIYYYQKPEVTGDKKLYALQPWDVEHSFTLEGAVNSNIVGDFYGAPLNGYWGAVQQHDDFKEAVSEIWRENLRPLFSELLGKTDISGNHVDSLDIYAETYRAAMSRNELLWGGGQNLDAKIESIRWWLENRIPYLDSITDIYVA